MREDPLAFRNGEYFLTDTVQKSIIFDRTMIMWAGRKYIADLIIKAILASSQNGRDLVDPKPLVFDAGLNTEHLKETAIIYHYMEPNGFLRRWNFGCKAVPMKSGPNLLVSGSGTWNFLENWSFTEEPEHVDFRVDLLSRIGSHYVTELFGSENLNHLYGGWLEITGADINGFQKTPYAVKFWKYDGRILSSGGPLFFGWYQDDHLIISRLFLDKGRTRGKANVSHFVVPPYPASRSAPIHAPDKLTTPVFLINIVLQANNSNQATLVIPYAESESIIEIDPSGFRVKWNDNLKTLLKAKPSGPLMRMVEHDHLRLT